jgi:hypothetical protein
VEKIIKAAIDSGKDIPEGILNRPRISAENIFFWDAFTELSTCRGDGCVPWTAIDQYAKRYDVCDDLFEELVVMIGVLDNVTIEHREKERKKK